MPTIADTNWEIVGVGDFDGDGKSDVILRNKATGQDIGWLMNGLTVSSSAFMPTIADTNWEIKGVGDFDGDGKADVVLRNKSTGQDIGWLMNGLTVSASAFLPTIADMNWDIKGAGDFDGDGKADIILRKCQYGPEHHVADERADDSERRVHRHDRGHELGSGDSVNLVIWSLGHLVIVVQLMNCAIEQR